MNKFFKHIFFFYCLLMLSPAQAGDSFFFSSDDPQRFQSQALSAFDKVKQRIEDLKNQNMILKNEYDELIKQSQHLEALTQHRRKEVQRLEKSIPDHVQISQPIQPIHESHDLKSLQAEVNLYESKILHMQQQLLEVHDYNQMMELKVADLKYQKREYMLQMKEIKNDKTAKKIDGKRVDKEIEKLRKNISQNKDIEKLLKQKMADFPTEEVGEAHSALALEKEKLDLEFELEQLQTKIDIVQRENLNLQNKQDVVEKRFQAEKLKKQEEILSLKKNIQVSESEYDILQASIQNQIQKKESRQNVLQNMIDLDRENQSLREKIEALQKKL